MSVVVTVDVINNAYHRKLVESAVPSYSKLMMLSFIHMI